MNTNPEKLTTRKSRLDVHLYVTPVCNLSCAHCYYDARTRKETPEYQLSLEEVARVLDELCTAFDVDISLEGGELFLRPGIQQLLEPLPTNVLNCLTLTTNGTIPIRVNPVILRSLRDLRISADGHTDGLNRTLRGVSLKPILRTCQRLSDQGVPFTIRMTVWRGNASQIPQILEWVGQQDFRKVSLFEFQSSGRGVQTASQHSIGDDLFSTFLSQLASAFFPSCLSSLKVNLNQSRVEEVHRWADVLANNRINVLDLPNVANCTINYDGQVGISPWRITADGTPDSLFSIDKGSLVDSLMEGIEAELLTDDSGHLSRIQLLYERE